MSKIIGGYQPEGPKLEITRELIDYINKVYPHLNIQIVGDREKKNPYKIKVKTNRKTA